MKEETVIVDGKEFKVHELLAVEEDEILDKTYTKNSDRTKEYVMKCANISEEDYKKLTSKERLAIVKAMNKLNGSENFQ